MNNPIPSSLIREISPPRLSKRQRTSRDTPSRFSKEPSLAAVEAGRAKIANHLAYFTERLSKSLRATPNDESRLSINEFVELYQRNQHEHGNHFVIHQHDHPISGVHYDLRLQFSKSSSLSFAVPKGLPGDPNSKQQGRMAIETRVHNLWNHLIESASLKTGSLLIWDTGTYSILPRKSLAKNPPSPQTTDCDSDEDADSETFEHKGNHRYNNEKLIGAFQGRYIRLRLHGTRLPEDYTITLRLPSVNDIQPSHPTRKRRTRRPRPQRESVQPSIDSDSHSDSETETHIPPIKEDEVENIDTDNEEDVSTRTNNAYPGATNSIGSIHQRRWFMSLDRQSSGFIIKKSGAEKGTCARREDGGGFEPFYVMGKEVERSVVTGRLAKEVESDEGVVGFVGRTGWVGIGS